ncbi:MAG: phosphate signaling complex protein PhoU [Candidatus Thiodiazotropha sp. (ex Dulcina madagascariensis)]|nr:phosphate signaling complex protein PhoU [Candidatus Thiodiazotropha sp. (ex Dulcina madagascariensis)]MCU7925899.1 phosphate signaling complex protein PhoU [Candidatus Thiodiazotropha sp. (ex Dulcina madagascariensis)]
MSHLEERLERDLNNIHDRVAKMGTQVQEAVKNAVNALQTGNTKLAYATVLNDNPINRCMRDIDKICHRFFAIHIPSGGHLRLLSSVIRANIELERIGDYAVTIARETAQLSQPPSGNLGRELDRIANETMRMLQQAIHAFTELNADIAKSTMVMADEFEHNLDVVYTEMIANNERARIKEVLATFVVFNQLKRIADQAKNLCEDTVFAVTGEQKARKSLNILFIDEDNSCLSQLAEAIGRKNHPQTGNYRSAGRIPADAINPNLVSFMENRGIDFSQAQLTTLDQLTAKEISDQHVIVSLQGGLSSYLPQLPFHTSGIEWGLGEIPEDEDEHEFELLYHEIAILIKDLMELLRGEGAN